MAAPHVVRTGPPAGHGGPADPDRGMDGTGSSGRAVGLGEDAGGGEAAQAGGRGRRGIRSWPLLLLALPAGVAVWSGWVGIGRLTGFGEVRPLPGIWDSLHLDTAVTLPVGVEAYAAYALHAWLTNSGSLTDRTRRFAKWSAIGSLLLGMAGQVAYHLLTEAGTTRAPWGITTAVACMPVLILGMAAALAHLISSDSSAVGRTGQLDAADPADRSEDPIRLVRAERLAQGRAAAAQLVAAGQRVSRRTLRAAGMRGSNVELGTLARLVGPQCSAEETRMHQAATQRLSDDCEG